MKDFICDHCGNTFKDYPSQRKTQKVFCSHACKSEWNKTVQGPWAGKSIPFYKRPNRNVKGDLNPRWKGGRRIDKDGYVLIWQPNHPNSDYHGYVREHRLVVEHHLGRILTLTEVVHHLDGDKQNNLITNLEVHEDGSSHQKKHYAEHTGAYPYLKNKREDA